MRRRLAGALVALGVCIVLSAVLPARLLPPADVLLQQLSISESEAHDSFFNAIWDGSSYVPGGQKVFKAAAPDRKVAIVRGLGTMLKAYTRTPVFKARYAEYLESNRPRPDRDGVKTMAEQDADMASAIQEAEENLKNVPPEMRKQMEAAVKEMKAQQEAFKKNTQARAMMESAVKQAQADQERDYQERLATFKAEHPANPDALVASRLKQFLALSADVNYQAKLVKQGGLMRFEDPALEEKPAEWKLCFRAGREATDAARAFAAEWLKELPGK